MKIQSSPDNENAGTSFPLKSGMDKGLISVTAALLFSESLVIVNDMAFS